MAGFSTNVETVLERKVNIRQSRECDRNFIETYELTKCADWIKKGGFQRVCLQFPDEYLVDAVSVSMFLKSVTEAEIFILADTSYSSCCVDSIAASHVDSDAIVHFGPCCLSPCSGVPVFYVYPPGNLNVADLRNAIRSIANENLRTVVFYETRYHKYLNEVKSSVSDLPSVFIAELEEPNTSDAICGRKIPETCQQAVFIGSESMLLTNLVLILPDTSWYIFEDNHLREFSTRQNKFLMKRIHLVEKLKDSTAVGVLVGTLSIDGCLEAVDRVKKLCKSSGKKCYTVAVGRPNIAKLANFPEIDVFVLVSCPENQLFVDTSEYFQPIVSLLEVELAFGGRPWSTDYTLDFRQLQPGGKLFCRESEVREDEGDVSLVTGKVRNLGVTVGEEATESNTALVEKTFGSLVTSHGANYLSTRSWGGLEQKLGETPVEKVVKGRRGIPLAYEDEGSNIQK